MTEGPLTVCHTRQEPTDVYGGRVADGGDAMVTEPTQKGWLGNPWRMNDDSVSERRRVVARYTAYLLDRVQNDLGFRLALESLGDCQARVGCWCRSSDQPRTPDTFCHLDVVNAYLAGDLSPVWAFLRDEDE